MSDNLRASAFRVPEFVLVFVGARPFRCGHCFHRQYAVVSPLLLAMIAVFRKIDTLVNLIHPDSREEYFSQRRRRRRRKSVRTGRTSKSTRRSEPISTD